MRSTSPQRIAPAAAGVTGAGRLGAIVDCLDAVVVDLDLQGVIVGWSPQAESMYGYSAEEAIGRSFAILLRDDPRGGELALRFERIGDGLRIGPAAIVQSTKAGRRIDVLLTLAPVRDALGAVVAAVAVARDLSAERRAEQAVDAGDARWKALIQSVVDGVIVIDGRGRIETFNPAAEQLFGYTAAEIVGQSVNRLMPPPDCDEHDGHMRRYLSSGERKIIGIGRQVTGRRRDGTTFPLHLSVGEMSVEGDRKFVGVLHDLTARVQMEERLREQMARARLGEMAMMLAQEVRNPIAGVRAALEVIHRRLPAHSGDGAAVGEIFTRIDALDALLRDLLRFARPPRPRRVPIDAMQAVAAAVALAAEDPLFQCVRVACRGSSPPIAADPELLTIALLNMLTSAAHAMSGEGAIDVSIAAAGAWCRIAVADDGPGVPAGARETLFAPFVPTGTRRHGLGLAVAKQIIVDAHAGDIRVECPKAGGMVIVVTLPCIGAAASEAAGSSRGGYRC